MRDVVMALLGSGEFDPWSEPVERELLRRSRDGGGPDLFELELSLSDG